MTLPVPAGTWIHVDAVGGVSGDMFAAAAVATWPELLPRIGAAVSSLALPLSFTMQWPTVQRAGIASRRFVFEFDRHGTPATGAVAAIKALLAASALAPVVRAIAIGILDLIAAAEGEVHGMAAAAVHLHEVADWDSIVDLVAAATIIDAVGPATWVCPVLPLGAGTLKCAHGILPVPAPATAILCRGAHLRSDGIAGERVTPTGAAILAYLRAFDPSAVRSGRLVASGYGAGTQDFGELPNVLRLLVLEGEGRETDQVAVLSFDIDDQSPEDLAIGLDRLRSVAGVLSASYVTAMGKKGRMCFRIELLARAAHAAEIAQACFRETSTLGVRWRVEDRWRLNRRAQVVATADGGAASVKVAARPGGVFTAKVEADAMAQLQRPCDERALIKAALEAQALSGAGEGDGET